jgi:hypothetical protein
MHQYRCSNAPVQDDDLTYRTVAREITLQQSLALHLRDSRFDKRHGAEQQLQSGTIRFVSGISSITYIFF